MLLVEELVGFARGLDDDHRHPVATAAADAWSLHDPVFVRSSASHVFVARLRDGSGRVVLRLRPDEDSHRAVMGRACRAATRWHERGAPMTPAMPSDDGNVVECVAGHAVMALRAVEGTTLEEQGLPTEAGAWGAALARLHRADPGITGLPHAVDHLAASDADPALADRTAELLEALGDLPRTPDVHGVLHGDPEADNVVAGPDGLCFVDPDEAREGWFASDVAFALRDWSPPGRGPDLEAEVVQQFLAGYRGRRGLSEDEVAWLPLLAQVSAAEDLHAWAPHLVAVPDPGWPPWAVDLDARVRSRAAALRESLLGGGGVRL